VPQRHREQQLAQQLVEVAVPLEMVEVVLNPIGSSADRLRHQLWPCPSL